MVWTESPAFLWYVSLTSPIWSEYTVFIVVKKNGHDSSMRINYCKSEGQNQIMHKAGKVYICRCVYV